MKAMINKITRTIRIAIAISVIMMVSLSTMQAQKPGKGAGQAPPEQRAANITARMKTELKLTPAQEPKILAINLKIAKKMDELKKISDEKARHKAVGELNKQREEEYKTVLTADQLKSYDKMKEEMKANQQKHKK